MLGRPILQEYDILTVDGRAMHPAEFSKLATSHILIEIVEACWGESGHLHIEKVVEGVRRNPAAIPIGWLLVRV